MRGGVRGGTSSARWSHKVSVMALFDWSTIVTFRFALLHYKSQISAIQHVSVVNSLTMAIMQMQMQMQTFEVLALVYDASSNWCMGP